MDSYTNKGTGISVNVKPGVTLEEQKRNLELALRKFKKKQKEFNMLIEIKNREFYTKPSAKRRTVIQKAISRRKHQDIKDKLIDDLDFF